MLKNKKSILFVNPDYHCTFQYRRELEKRGWKVRIYVAPEYPRKILYTDEQIISFLGRKKSINAARLKYLVWLTLNIHRYHFILFYGRPMRFPMQKIFKVQTFFGNIIFFPELLICKLARRKVIYLPSGCRDEFLKEKFGKFDNGNVCNNCGIENICNDKENKVFIDVMKRNSKMIIGQGYYKRSEFVLTSIPWKSIDLDLWHPNIELPPHIPQLRKHRDTILILHSTALENRNSLPRNIKGSQFIEEAVLKLKNEGFNCELISVRGIESKEMRFYQVQADIIVDQLIYGSWGSTTIESLALGKPTICYLRSEWKDHYLESFGLTELPIIGAGTDSIYIHLKELLMSEIFRRDIGVKSRLFAEKMFDVSKNVDSFIKELNLIA